MRNFLYILLFWVFASCIVCKDINTYSVVPDNLDMHCNTNHLSKIVIFGANSATGKQFIKILSTQCNVEDVNLIFSSIKSLKSFDRKFPRSKFHKYVIDVRKDSIPQDLVENAVVISLVSSVPKFSFKKLMTINWLPFHFPKDKNPEKVDWIGQKRLIESSKDAQHFILVSSMLGTQVDNFLNKIDDANILLWKRKAEIHLTNSGINYTIIHCPKLKNGQCLKNALQHLFLSVNDEHIKDASYLNRSDLAVFLIECVTNLDLVKNLSFDLIYRKNIGLNSLLENKIQILTKEFDNKKYDYSKPQHPILIN